MFTRSQFPRVTLTPVGHPAEANLHPRYPIERADWIWLPDHRGEGPAFARFELDFAVPAETRTRLHVSADERLMLWLDGQLLARGPDMSDPWHWSFASYEIVLTLGLHRLEAIVIWLGELAPFAQMHLAPGFILAIDAVPEADTGRGSWRVAEIEGISYGPGMTTTFHVVGPSFRFDATRWFASRPAITPIKLPRKDVGWGTIQAGHRFHPTPLPEQLWVPRHLGRVRAVRPLDAPEAAWTTACDSGDLAAWQALLDGSQSIRLAPGEARKVLCDFNDYVCGHPFVTWSGAGSELQWDWAESLYLDPPPDLGTKGDRNQIDGKYFQGFGDTFIAAAGRREQFNPAMRSGRYIRLRATAGPVGAEITALEVAETRYDAPRELEIETPDADLQAALRLMHRTLETGHHEVFCDAPYFEQLMYTGDTHVRLLSEYLNNRDTASARRAIELFDWSRRECAWIASRYPSRFFQLIPIYSLSWIFMVRDYAWWRDDPATVRAALPAMRTTLDGWLELLTADGLIDRPPGWNVLDIVPGWTRGEPPGLGSGGSTSINLMLLLALRTAADLELLHDHPERATVWSAHADTLRKTLVARRWNPATGLWCEADGEAGLGFTEHAQALSVLADALPPNCARRAFEAWQRALPRFPPTNLYFEFFVFAALTRIGRAEMILDRLDFWRQLPARGFVTTPEHRADSTRSDCHAWAAHPLHHLVSGIAGIRPDAPGFARVLIAPRPGHWPSLRVRCAHPPGSLAVDLAFSPTGEISGTIELPAHVTGRLLWNGIEHALPAGLTELSRRHSAAP